MHGENSAYVICIVDLKPVVFHLIFFRHLPFLHFIPLHRHIRCYYDREVCENLLRTWIYCYLVTREVSTDLAENIRPLAESFTSVD